MVAGATCSGVGKHSTSSNLFCSFTSSKLPSRQVRLAVVSEDFNPCFLRSTRISAVFRCDLQRRRQVFEKLQIYNKRPMILEKKS